MHLFDTYNTLIPITFDKEGRCSFKDPLSVATVNFNNGKVNVTYQTRISITRQGADGVLEADTKIEEEIWTKLQIKLQTKGKTGIFLSIDHENFSFDIQVEFQSPEECTMYLWGVYRK